MKKYRIECLAGFLVLSLSLAGCRDRRMPNNQVVSQGQTVNDVLAEKTKEAASTPTPAVSTPEATPEPAVSEPVYETVDVDLTGSSETMLYSEVIMLSDQLESNLGKVIKIRGQFMDFHDDMSENSYPTVIVLDATKCCATGLVIQLENGGAFPAEGEEFTVIGVYSDFLAEDSPFPTLADAVIVEG